ncbi:MAG: hypothetical protein RI538_07535 [Salibaculum sp.]|uniref:hypothetical protein n=2 Tax=Salibaculum sp. TaxID=2855480 RepID=UPI0028707EB3|nr:hypothetical protein [Salibaculum sp.]MDR9482622.1 hypothetical protein [Salibaculum sp.]
MLSDSHINLAKDFAAAFGVVAVVFVITIAIIILLRRYRITKHLATAVAIMGLSIFLALRLDDLETDKTGAYAIIYAAALGTLGWAFTLYETRSNQRRDFTLQFMRSINESSMIERHKLNVSTRYPYGVKVDEQDVDQLFRDLQDPNNYNDQSAPTL